MLDISNLREIFLAILSAILLILIFPNFNFSFLAWVSLLPLLIAVEKKDLMGAFLLGFLSGIIAYLGILYWLGETLVRYGYISRVVSYFILLALASYLALYIGIFCLVLRFFILHSPYRILHILFGGFLWVSLELFRAHLFSGFPWVILAYSQWENISLIQISEFTGCYGVSFLIVMVNVALKEILGTKWQGEILKRKIRIFIIVLGSLIVCYGYGCFVVKKAEDPWPKIQMAVLQGNIPQTIKWNEAYKKRIITIYDRLVKKIETLNLQVIVWPETALPGYIKYEKDLNYSIKELIRRSNCYHIIGGPDIEYEKGPLVRERYYNSAFLFSPEGKILNKYDKVHLVPFGEMVPIRSLFSKIIRVLNEMGDFDQGKEIKILGTSYANFGVIICFEVIFPHLVRTFVKNGAEVMVNITNDAWFGKTSAPYQHFSNCIFRAVENRVNIVRAANTGISGFIDVYGRIKKSTPLFIEGYVGDKVSLSKKKSFYTKYGDIFAYGCIIMTIILMVIPKKNSKIVV